MDGKSKAAGQPAGTKEPKVDMGLIAFVQGKLTRSRGSTSRRWSGHFVFQRSGLKFGTLEVFERMCEINPAQQTFHPLIILFQICAK